MNFGLGGHKSKRYTRLAAECTFCATLPHLPLTIPSIMPSLVFKMTWSRLDANDTPGKESS